MAVQSDDTPKILQDIGSQLPAEYALIEYLGEGGHGLVLKAQSKTLQQNVALKIIKSDNSEEIQRRVQRIQNEAKVLARLNHRNIVKVFQLGACLDQTPFLVCEFVEGITLAQLLKKDRTLSPRNIVEIFSQILDALACAHENGLLHRDIKPSNIMIVKDKEAGSLEVKLLDFGIARDLEQVESQALGLTRTIQISGSAPYMSPEQCKGGRIDARSDLYSVACVLYECLAGYPPFRGDTPMHTRYMQIHDEAALPKDDDFAPTAGRSAVYKLVMEGLSKDPDKRPQTAQLFKTRLLEALPNALVREAWTPRNKPKILLGSLIAAAVLAALALTLNQYIHNKTADTDIKIGTSESSTVHKIPHTKRSQMKELNKEFDALDFTDKSLKSAQMAHSLLLKLTEFEKELGPTDQFMHYMVLREKGTILYKMTYPAEAKESLQKTLKYCRLPDGRQSADAVEIYMYLARLEFSFGNLKKAASYANTGIEVAKKSADASGTAQFLDIPSVYANRLPIFTSECYEVLADLELATHDFESEMKYRQLAEDERLKKERLRTRATPFLNLASAVRRVKGNDVAYEMVQKRKAQLMLLLDADTDPGEDYGESLFLIAEWLKANNYKIDEIDSYVLNLKRTAASQSRNMSSKDIQEKARELQEAPK